MKNILIILLFFLTNTLDTKADWFKLDINGELIPFSKIAKEGKISVFIVCIPRCPPCEVLKDNLYSDKTIDLNKVDFYDINLTTKITEEQRKAQKTFAIWQEAEKLKGFPYIYILSPVLNITSRGNFNASKTKENIDNLMKLFEDFESDKMLANESEIVPYNSNNVVASKISNENVEKYDDDCNSNDYTFNEVNIKVGHHPYEYTPFVRIIFEDVNRKEVNFENSRRKVDFSILNKTFNKINLEFEFKKVGKEFSFEQTHKDGIKFKCEECKILSVKSFEMWNKKEKGLYFDIAYDPF